MSYDELDREEQAEKAEQRRKSLLTAGAVLLGCLLVLIIGLRFGGRIAEAVTASVDPPVRTDIVHYILLDNSGSIVSWGLKKQAAREAVQVSQSLGTRPIQTVMVRIGHDAAEIYRGANTEENLVRTLRDHYENTRPDPQPGTFAAPSLEQILRETSTLPKKLVLITLAADSLDDTASVRIVAQKLKTRGNVFVVQHAVPVHDPRNSPVQLQLREEARKAFAPLGGAYTVAGKTELPGVASRWLPAKLAAAGWKP